MGGTPIDDAHGSGGIVSASSSPPFISSSKLWSPSPTSPPWSSAMPSSAFTATCVTRTGKDSAASSSSVHVAAEVCRALFRTASGLSVVTVNRKTIDPLVTSTVTCDGSTPKVCATVSTALRLSSAVTCATSPSMINVTFTAEREGVVSWFRDASTEIVTIVARITIAITTRESWAIHSKSMTLVWKGGTKFFFLVSSHPSASSRHSRASRSCA